MWSPPATIHEAVRPGGGGDSPADNSLSYPRQIPGFGCRSDRSRERTCRSVVWSGHGDRGSVGGRTIQFDFRLEQYTTDEELQKVAQLARDEGTDALRRALEKRRISAINVVGSTGNQIGIARKRQAGPDTIIPIITARTMPFDRGLSQRTNNRLSVWISSGED